MIDLVIIAIWWIISGFMGYIHWISVCKHHFGDVLGVEWGMILAGVFFALGGPMGLIGVFIANLISFGFKGTFVEPQFIFKPQPPSDPRFRYD